ncbi:MAG: sulfotransferase [Gammaproteobacteria bacterium]|nr:sulfotransferase [Gammaproteobacteria bacterium]
METSSRPTFIGIGAQKCASSWLHRIAGCHPDVGVSKEKEVDFFSYHFDHGYQWYESRFRHCADRRAVGETSPSYFCDPRVPVRVRRYAPAMRIIVSLRDPVERALSNHRHEVRVGHVRGDLSFNAGLDNNPMYIDQSRYATHLRRWLRHFPSEQIMIVLMEDITADPLAVVQRVYRFLGVDPAFVPPQVRRHDNPAYATRYRVLTSLKDGMYRHVDSVPPVRWLWRSASALGLRTLYRRANVMPSAAVIPDPDPVTLGRLREVFEPEVRELSRMLGRPLDAWLPR